MKRRKKYIIISAIAALAAVIGGSVIANQGLFKPKVTIAIGNWPKGGTPEIENFEALKAFYEKVYPNVEIIPDTYDFSVNTFEEMARENKLPNLYGVYFTEINKIINRGYAADITDELEEMGWKRYINPDILSMLSDSDQRVYGVPDEVYVQGLYINKKIFRQAGLVNPDGSIMIPDNLDEMAEYARIIKEKTGKAGFCIPTTENGGGWHFLNIAWDFGTKFMKSDGAGNYIATFDTEETRQALQYIKDLEHVYHVLPNEKIIDVNEARKLFSTEQVAMMFMNLKENLFLTKSGMAKEDIMVARMPEGKAGRYAQIGGKVWMFSKDSSSEQILAGLRWLDTRGFGPILNESQIAEFEKMINGYREEGQIVLDRQVFDMWTDPETNAKVNGIYQKYSNTEKSDYEDYLNFNGVILRPEEPSHCQELYAILDKCIQKVIIDENADIPLLVKNANTEFQTQYLDNDKY